MYIDTVLVHPPWSGSGVWRRSQGNDDLLASMSLCHSDGLCSTRDDVPLASVRELSRMVDCGLELASPKVTADRSTGSASVAVPIT